MNKLLSYSCTKLASENPSWAKPDRFLSFYNYFPGNIGIYDRTGANSFLFNCENKWPIPIWDNTFALSYEECVMLRAKELLTKSIATGKKIRLYYSGGIDSSTIFCSFLRLLGLDKMKEHLEIACTFHSRKENPHMWDNYIRKGDFDLIDANNAENAIDPNRIVIMGECNDQLFGSDALINFQINTTKENAYRKWTPGTIADYFAKTNSNYSEYWAENFAKTMDAAPFKIENHYQFWWWYNFCWKWNNVVVRILFYLNEHLDDALTEDTAPIQFFNTEYFQQWSISMHYNEPDKNAYPHEYKMLAKEFVVNTTKEKGFLAKVKNPSLFRIFYSTSQNHAITSDYKVVRNWRTLEDFINPNFG